MRDIEILDSFTNLGDSYIFYNTNENECETLSHFLNYIFQKDYSLVFSIKNDQI